MADGTHLLVKGGARVPARPQHVTAPIHKHDQGGLSVNQLRGGPARRAVSSLVHSTLQQAQVSRGCRAPLDVVHDLVQGARVVVDASAALIQAHKLALLHAAIPDTRSAWSAGYVLCALLCGGGLAAAACACHKLPLLHDSDAAGRHCAACNPAAAKRTGLRRAGEPW